MHWLGLLALLWAPLCWGWGEQAEPPANLDRFLGCPIEDQSDSGLVGGTAGKWLTYKDLDFSTPQWWLPFENELKVLDGLLPSSYYHVTVIDIRRVNGHYAFRYLGNGASHVPVLPWSSSKWLAALNMIRKFDANGLSANSYIGPYHVGDLITTSHTGHRTPTVSNLESNYIGTMFQDYGGRQNADSLIKDWLKRPDESFLSGYGVQIPAGSEVVRDAETNKSAVIQHSGAGGGRSRISTLTFAEALKRIATQNDSWNNVPFPGITDDDLRILFYGSPNQSPGGMLVAYEEPIRKALGGKAHLDKRTNGEWRIFSKTGSADWTTGQEQIVNAIVCLPHVDKGRFFVASFYVKGPVLKLGKVRLHEGYVKLVNYLVPEIK